ncbi:MAG: prephenate dehydratase [Candidatus Omnitrophica bacterium]|nr:prephenate dehydratase [Candidatus Omnitrophota bacterium]MDD5027261.1 prephenate dehydratase [Candidatus Omnitrophota bacterium]MDD5661862.1 prephenate dehydratase [Candidatus Omnitrophota bacterium]
MSLKNLRRKIDSLDKKIIQFLNARARITLDIAGVKSKSGRSIYVPEREKEVLRKAVLLSRGPLAVKALEAIYREIMSSSLALEKPLKIAYMGPEASFSNLAALKRFGSQVNYVACGSIADVFLEVEREASDYGVVPVENSIEGAVTHTLDMLVDSDLKICSQIILDVAHNLLARSTKDKIRRVYSNPQVLAQCRIWLQENLPKAEQVEVSSTTAAAKIVAKERNTACVASLLAGKVYKLKVLARDIEDSPHNITRFFVIGKTDAGKTGRDRTSILFSIKDKVGALHDMLLPFKRYKINLTKIESRPSKRKAWDYYFFVDLEGHQQDPRIQKALRELESKCKFLKVLGSYPI